MNATRTIISTNTYFLVLFSLYNQAPYKYDLCCYTCNAVEQNHSNTDLIYQQVIGLIQVSCSPSLFQKLFYFL